MYVMWNLISQIIAGIGGIWLAQKFVSGVEFIGPLQTLLTCGAILGLLNFFVKPILKAITLPIRIITLGLFGLVINMIMVWVADIIFLELIISGIVPLFWTSIIIWALSLTLSKWAPGREAGE